MGRWQRRPHGGLAVVSIEGFVQERPMRIAVGRVIMGAVLGLFVLASGLQADEKLSLDKVPARIKRALKTKYPKANVVSAAKETEQGKTVYEFKLEDGAKKWEATFTPAGSD